MEKSHIPSESECLELMAEVDLVPAVVRHSIAVKNFALELAEDLEKRGTAVNKPLLSAAALLHDIMKVDAEVCHCIEGGDFLREKGFPEVASVTEKHGLINLDVPHFIPRTTEEKLLMYADLRTMGRVVSLEERFNYIKKRYTLKEPKKFQEVLAFAKQLEWELFGKVDDKGGK